MSDKDKPLFNFGGWLKPGWSQVKVDPDECIGTPVQGGNFQCRRGDHPTPTSDCTTKDWVDPPPPKPAPWQPVTPEEVLRERVAAAIYEDEYARARVPHKWDETGDGFIRRLYRGFAASAIKAMREESA